MEHLQPLTLGNYDLPRASLYLDEEGHQTEPHNVLPFGEYTPHYSVKELQHMITCTGYTIASDAFTHAVMDAQGGLLIETLIGDERLALEWLLIKLLEQSIITVKEIIKSIGDTFHTKPTHGGQTTIQF